MFTSLSIAAVGPKHKRITEELRLLARGLAAGGRLPSERELATTHGCNFLTIRKALLPLVEDGTVVRITGRGTFVVRRRPDGVEEANRKRVGLLLTPESDAYAWRVVQSLAQEAALQGVELRSVWFKSIGVEGLAQARALRAEGCVALTIPWFPHDRGEELRAFARECPLPLSLPLLVPGLEAYCFEDSGVFGASIVGTVETLCRYHQRLGRTKLAFLGPDAKSDPLLQRMLVAYARFTAHAGTPGYCGLVGPDVAAMQDLALRWRAHRGELAVVCYDDAHALRLMTAMHKLGLSCPHDYTVVGINDTEASRFSDPPLSTIRQDFGYVGRWLLRAAVSRAEGGSLQSNASPAHRLVVRESCGGGAHITPDFAGHFPGLEFSVEREPDAPAQSSALRAHGAEALSVA